MLKKFSDTRVLAKSGYNFIRKWFLLNQSWGSVLFGGKLKIDAKNLNFEIFETESAHYMKSGSMPLNLFLKILMSTCAQVSAKRNSTGRNSSSSSSDEGIMTAVCIAVKGEDFCNQVQLRKVRKEKSLIQGR